jgi:hypothetical protein
MIAAENTAVNQEEIALSPEQQQKLKEFVPCCEPNNTLQEYS